MQFAEAPGLVDLGLDHLNLIQRVGLRDDVLAGFFNNESGEVFKGFALNDDDVLLDYGCGSGGPLEFCLGRAGRIIALDSDAAVLDQCRELLNGKTTSSIDFMLADGAFIDLPDETASKVMCLEVLEHVDDPDTTLSELTRIGNDGCLYLISVPDPRSEEVLRQLAPRAAFEKPHHVRIIQPTEFRSMVEGAGLEIQSQTFVGGFSSVFTAIYFSRIDALGLNGVCSIVKEIAYADPVLSAWAKAWNDILDGEYGYEIKRMIDLMIPKSQVIIARKNRPTLSE
jgi:SAM-dependent methyltransferase